MSKGIIVGVTGGFGTGKSTVAKMFGRLGAVMISADKIAHDVIMPGEVIYKKVISLFGVSILNRDKTIDRKKLGRIVFNDRKSLKLLNNLIHPEVIKRIKEIVKKKSRRSGAIFIVDVPLLIEAGLLNMVDKLIVVTADRKTQIKRCMERMNLTRADVIKRIRNQMPLSKKRLLADFIIDNNGSFNSTKKKVEKVWEEIRNGTR